jgi:hypothetical protein
VKQRATICEFLDLLYEGAVAVVSGSRSDRSLIFLSSFFISPRSFSPSRHHLLPRRIRTRFGKRLDECGRLQIVGNMLDYDGEIC